MNLEARINRIKIIAFDVDGVLTDGSIIMPSDEEVKVFNVKDGLGIVMARKLGFVVVFISGRKSSSLERRAAELNVDHLIMSSKDKKSQMMGICEKLSMSLENVAYMGDDYNDLPLLAACGISACPQDAMDAVKERVDIVIEEFGGKGAARQFIEKILRTQGMFESAIKLYFEDY